MTGRISTHVLDTVAGRPGRGVRVELARLADGTRTSIASVVTNDDGRTDAPLVSGAALVSGEYEIVFHIGEHFRASGAISGPAFLERVPVRFTVHDASQHYHVPLLCSPWSYSTYRGS